MEKHFLLYGHGGAYNHGAEAIIITTVELLRKLSPGCRVTLSTHFIEQDRELNLPVDEYCVRDSVYAELDKQSETKGLYNPQIYKQTIDVITKNTICLSVGGDNYCYPNWQRYAYIHQEALERGAVSLLWSCSIEPSAITPEMLAVLNSHHLITARESITYNALRDLEIDRVLLSPDIAFALGQQETPLPENFLPQNTVALNISPLLIRQETKPGLVLANMQMLADYLMNETDMNMVLIPHVTMPMDNDCEVLAQIKFTDASRVWRAPANLSAKQYKYIIAKCRFGVFARTHAAIAAYSCGVPCLALGYSVKAQGIAADVGMSDHVVPVGQICAVDTLKKLFIKMAGREEAIKTELRNRLVAYGETLMGAFHGIF